MNRFTLTKDSVFVLSQIDHVQQKETKNVFANCARVVTPFNLPLESPLQNIYIITVVTCKLELSKNRMTQHCAA